MKKEENLQIAICRYLKYQYPNLYFLTDASGLRLPMGLAVKAKKQRSKHAQLDLVILRPNGKYCGLILELKKDKSQVYKLNGEFKKGKHIDDQNKSIEHLNGLGYLAVYVFSFAECVTIINQYLKNSL